MDTYLCSLLNQASAEDLDFLLACIRRRHLQQLTRSPEYLAYQLAQDKAPYRQAYIERMAQSILNIGSHALNQLRGRHNKMSYEAILWREVKRLRLRFPQDASIDALEMGILGTVLARVWRRLSARERDDWMRHHLLLWSQREGVSQEQLLHLSDYCDDTPSQQPIDDLLDAVKSFCVQELPDGEAAYVRLIHHVFESVQVHLSPVGVELRLMSAAFPTSADTFSLAELMGDQVPHLVSSSSLVSYLRLWLRSPSSPMPSSSHDPNSGMWRILGNVIQQHPVAFLSSMVVVPPLVPTLVAAAAGTALALAIRPVDRVLKPVVIFLICMKIRQQTSS